MSRHHALPVLSPAKLRHYRLAQGLTQRELAREVGVTMHYVSNLETGRRSAGPRVMWLLAQAFNVEVPELWIDDATDLTEWEWKMGTG